MIRWPLRTAGVWEAIFTPATITHSSWRLRARSLARVTPRSAQQRLVEAHEVPGGVQPEDLELGPHHLGVGVVGERVAPAPGRRPG